MDPDQILHTLMELDCQTYADAGEIKIRRPKRVPQPIKDALIASAELRGRLIDRLAISQELAAQWHRWHRALEVLLSAEERGATPENDEAYGRALDRFIAADRALGKAWRRCGQPMQRPDPAAVAEWDRQQAPNRGVA